MQRIPITKAGADKIFQELSLLEKQKVKLAEVISEARKHGDLRENAEYHEARNAQSFTAGRILDLKSKISRFQIIDPAKIAPTGRVMFGVWVELLNLDNNIKVIYQIVGEDEADLTQGKLAINTPTARALINHALDEEIEINTPSGVIYYKILQISHQPIL